MYDISFIKSSKSGYMSPVSLVKSDTKLVIFIGWETSRNIVVFKHYLIIYSLIIKFKETQLITFINKK